MERSIGYIRRSFFVPLVSRYRQLGQALDLEALNLAFARWLAITATTRNHGTTGEVPYAQLLQERATLQALPPSRCAGLLRPRPVGIEQRPCGVSER